MPYHVVKRGDKHCVEKKSNGKSMGCHPSQAEAEKQMAAIHANEKPRKVASGYEGRRLTIAASNGYTHRLEQFEGRDYIVVPVVGLVEGVVHALNAKHGPEFVPHDVFCEEPERWDGKPLYVGHPLVNGVPVQGDNKMMRDTRAIGLVRNPGIKNDALGLEAWLDIALSEKREPEMLARARANEPIEISVGVLVASEEKSGVYGGRTYTGEWLAIDPDHLALLPDGVLGACSMTMGCGVRAMQDAIQPDAPDDMYVVWPSADGSVFEGLRNISQDVRDKMPKEDFAGPNESFPIEMPVDVSNAAQAIGRAKGNRADIKRRIIAIAYRKGNSFVSHLPEDWRKKSDMKAASTFASIMQAARELFTGQSANEMGNNDLRRKLYDALRDIEPTILNVEDFFPVTDPSHVVYTCYDGSDFGLYERSFTLASTGVITIGGMKVEVEPVTKYEPVEGATPEALEQNQGKGAPDSKKPETPVEETDMSKEQIVKFLESATPCQLTALGAFVEGGAKPAVVETPKPAPTEAELKALADADAARVQGAVEAGIKADREQRASDEKKSATVKALMAFKGQPFTVEVLTAKTQAELDSMLAMAEKIGPPKETRAAVDFGGQGAPGAGAGNEQTEAPAAPDMHARILEARKSSK